MGTAEDNRTREWRIAITPDTEAQLLSLEPAFRKTLAEVDDDNIGDFSDDELVAMFLGWHMRNQQHDFCEMTKRIWVEFTSRAQFAEDGTHYRPEYVERWLAARGVAPQNGNILTVKGIDTDTMHLLTKRVRELEVFLAKMAHVHVVSGDPEKNHATLLQLAEVPDQVIIDASVYFYAFSRERNAERSFPVSVVEEINARALHRMLSSNTDPELAVPGCVLFFPEEEAPSLRPRDRLAFTRARRINYNDPFWTDERILRAKKLGL